MMIGYTDTLVEIAYMVSSVLFIWGLKLLSSPKSAVKGNLISALGMLLAVSITLLDRSIITYQWIIVGVLIGGLIGVVAARMVAMTQMPEMVALFNGFGGGASLLVGCAEYHRYWQAQANISDFTAAAIAIAVIIGGITFAGSIIAYGKLSAKIPTKAVVFAGQRIINGILFLAIITLGIVLNYTDTYLVLGALIFLSLLMGITSVIAIGGADMPVVISLLNSYSGLAACAAGFVILNDVLIVVGSLVGASGIILTKIMCKAMNRSLANVLFSGFGANAGQAQAKIGTVKSMTPEDAYFVLEAARSVIIVPGYGMAVAQAQHIVKELSDFLEANGAEVKYAIHPVAGRMPGHMNVLLAEANVPYEQLVEPDDVNPTMETIDVCILIGANDVVNPAARDDQDSPIYGMPIIEVDRARTIFILKRSMNTGFSGLANPLFSHENASMIFGDAKDTVSKLVAEFKS